MGRLGEVLRFLEEQPAPVTPGGPAETSSAGDHAARPVSVATNGPASPPWPGPGGLVVPGLGTITAASRAASAARQAAGVFDEVQKTMWHAEAQQHLGRRVLISVKNAPEPIAGSLAQIAEDGVLLEQDDQRVAVSYLRITNIEADLSDN
jgi:hypothetical protein